VSKSLRQLWLFQHLRPQRQAFVKLHRCIGLAIAGFLVVCGLTGALLAWNEPLDALINPGLFHVTPPSPDAPPLDPLALRARIASQYPQAQIRSVPLNITSGRSIVFYLVGAVDPSTSKPATLLNNQIFVDPYSGKILGERYWGDLTQGKKNLMPFVFRLHYTLALWPGAIYIFGIVALLWTIDCFIGAYLTFPASGRRPTHTQARPGKNKKKWLARWWPAWTVRWGGGSYKINFDLHRASGLWLWLILLVFAWSAVSFTLPQIYNPVMRTIFAHQPGVKALDHRLITPAQPLIGWEQAREIGRRLMATQAAALGFTVRHETELDYDPGQATYRYAVHSSRDAHARHGQTSLYLDANTGALRGMWIPTGASSGDTITTWLTSIHTAALGGWLFRLFISTGGLAVAILSITGVAVWRRKRGALLRGKRHAHE
jgi:uncharacterized iron-regulated membrane protein